MWDDDGWFKILDRTTQEWEADVIAAMMRDNHTTSQVVTSVDQTQLLLKATLAKASLNKHTPAPAPALALAPIIPLLRSTLGGLGSSNAGVGAGRGFGDGKYQLPSDFKLLTKPTWWYDWGLNPDDDIKESGFGTMEFVAMAYGALHDGQPIGKALGKLSLIDWVAPSPHCYTGVHATPPGATSLSVSLCLSVSLSLSLSLSPPLCFSVDCEAMSSIYADMRAQC